MSFEISDKNIVIKSNESFLENENNTIYQSAKLLLNFMDRQMGVNIKIKKKSQLDLVWVEEVQTLHQH